MGNIKKILNEVRDNKSTKKYQKVHDMLVLIGMDKLGVFKSVGWDERFGIEIETMSGEFLRADFVRGLRGEREERNDALDELFKEFESMDEVGIINIDNYVISYEGDTLKFYV